MPRRARVIVPGVPHYIVQRGHNRQAVFVEKRDYEYYLENLAEWKEILGLQVYSYCLMTNHVHLIIGANERLGDMGELMKRLAGRQQSCPQWWEDEGWGVFNAGTECRAMCHIFTLPQPLPQAGGERSSVLPQAGGERSPVLSQSGGERSSVLSQAGGREAQPGEVGLISRFGSAFSLMAAGSLA